MKAKTICMIVFGMLIMSTQATALYACASNDDCPPDNYCCAGLCYPPVDCDSGCPDLNGDGNVDFPDLAKFAAAFGGDDCNADMNGDGIVDCWDGACWTEAYNDDLSGLTCYVEGCPPWRFLLREYYDMPLWQWVLLLGVIVVLVVWIWKPMKIRIMK